MSLRIIFAGTAPFAVTILEALLNSAHDVIAVYTQPDRPAGRGQQLHASPVKTLALLQEIPVFQPVTLKNPGERELLQELQADIIIVVAYGLLIPKNVLALFPHGGINVHASLLPRWRGAAPIQRAILAGDSISGVSIMQMESGLDTGPVWLQQTCTIEANMTSGELHDQLAILGAAALLTGLSQLEQGGSQPHPQDSQQACYAEKISKHEAEINWQLSAVQLHRQVCAFNPWPIAYTYYRQQTLRIWQTQVISQHITATPGTIVACSKAGIDVATSHGQLRVCVLQCPGGKPIAATDFINAQQQHLHPGVTLFGGK